VINLKKKNIINNKIKNVFSNQKGMALIATLIFTFILVSLGVALLTMTNNDSKLSTLQRESTRAFYLAETGIEEYIWYMNSSEENTVGLNFVGSLHEGDASEYYDAKFVTSDPGPPETKTIRSKGTVEGQGQYDKGTRTIEVKLKKEIAKAPDLFYDYAVLTDGDMEINGGVTFHGNIHSNSDFTNNGTINMEYGSITVTEDIIKDNSGLATNLPYQEFPHIAWDYYERISKKYETIDGQTYNSYYSGDKTFNSPETLYGIHFVNGNVTITNELILHNATILATGYIDLQTGNADVHLENSDSSNPLALVAKDYIEVTGNAQITGDGIIQTEGEFNLAGNVSIKGAVYADDGIFGGGGGSMNIYYDTDLVNDPVPGTGLPVWKKISWQEVYVY